MQQSFLMAEYLSVFIAGKIVTTSWTSGAIKPFISFKYVSVRSSLSLTTLGLSTFMPILGACSRKVVQKFFTTFSFLGANRTAHLVKLTAVNTFFVVAARPQSAFGRTVSLYPFPNIIVSGSKTRLWIITVELAMCNPQSVSWAWASAFSLIRFTKLSKL